MNFKNISIHFRREQRQQPDWQDTRGVCHVIDRSCNSQGVVDNVSNGNSHAQERGEAAAETKVWAADRHVHSERSGEPQESGRIPYHPTAGQQLRRPQQVVSTSSSRRRNHFILVTIFTAKYYYHTAAVYYFRKTDTHTLLSDRGSSIIFLLGANKSLFNHLLLIFQLMGVWS